MICSFVLLDADVIGSVDVERGKVLEEEEDEAAADG